MSANSVLVSESSVHISDLLLDRAQIADYLRPFPQDKVEQALIRAIEVGIFCLERASASQDIDFVRRQVDSLLNQVQKSIGKIPEDTQKALMDKIGSADGQVLAPVRQAASNVQAAAQQKIDDIKKLLEQDIDPTKQTTTLGKALTALRDLLDPKRNDSIQGNLHEAIENITKADGKLASVVKKTVEDTIKRLSDEVSDLAKEIRGQEAAQEIAQQTTLKGPEFEGEVLARIKQWAAMDGVEVEHVGTDNQPGDVVVKVNSNSVAGSSLTIVVEAKDREVPVGRKAITEAIAEAMHKRTASCAIWVSKNPSGFAKEIGEWAEGHCDRGRWLACTFALLPVALRFTLVQERLAVLRAAQPEVDAGSIVSQVQRIRTSLLKIGNITRKVTEVRCSAQEIQDEAEDLREEIKAGMAAIEDALRTKPVNNPIPLA